MSSSFKSPLASETDSWEWDTDSWESDTDSSELETDSVFPIQRLPDEILSRFIDVGSWFDHEANNTWLSDTKPRQKDFVRIASQVCSRWREIAQWQGHPHRWHMRLKFTFHESTPNVSLELSRFRQGLRASEGCDLLLQLVSWSRMDPDSHLKLDDPEVVNMQLFMHGIKLLLPYLPQILVLDIQISQSDPLHLMFDILQRWTTPSRLTSLRICYDGDKGMRAWGIGSSSSLSDSQLLSLPRNYNENDRLSHSLPPTLARVSLQSVILPKSFALPYGLTRLTIAESSGFTDSHSATDFHSLIPFQTQLTFLSLDLRNKTAPSTAFCLDGLVTFAVRTLNLISFLGWSQNLYAKNLHTLHLTVYAEEPPDFSPPSAIARSSHPLAPTLLGVSCAVGALRKILSCIALSNLVNLDISIEDILMRGQEEGQGKELVFPLLRTLTIRTGGQPWSGILECASFPALESLSCIYNFYLLMNECRDFTEWISFSSNHERNSFNNLVSLRIWLPTFEAGQYHPFEYTPNIEELEVDLQDPWPKDWDWWMIYPGPGPSHSPPLIRLRNFVVNVASYIGRDNNFEDELETKIHGIQASRVQYGIGLERARIQWDYDKSTEYQQSVTTGLLEKVL